MSSSTPLNVVVEKAKAKKRKIVRKKNMPPPIPVHIVEVYDSCSNEPLAKKTRKSAEPPVVEPIDAERSSASIVVKPDGVETAERSAEVVNQPAERTIEELSQQLVVLPAERPATASVDSLNPIQGIMDVDQAVNEEVGKEVNAPEKEVVESELALATQYNTMLEEPIARMEELEITPSLNEEDRLEEEKKRILLWIDWRTTNYAPLKAKINEMEDEEITVLEMAWY